jgi:hypothetical protein
LMELAAATRDHSIDAGVLRVYMPHLDGYTASEVVDACALLERESDWFPKVAELLRACSRARRIRQDRRASELAASTPKLIEPPPNPERVKEIMAKLKATAYQHRMPHAEASHD